MSALTKTMRVSVTAYEILSVFQYYQKERKALTLWQNIQGTRVKAEAIVFEASPKNDIKLLALGQEMPFRADLPLYIYGEHKTLLFKTTIKTKSGGELLVPLPKMVRFAEMRKIKRYDLSEIKNCQVGLRKHLDVQENKDYNFKINDLSDAGMSFLIGQEHNFKAGDVVQVNQIQNDNLTYTLNADIVHVSPLVSAQGIMDVKLKKVGVRFRSKLRLKDLYIYKKVIKDLT